LQLAELRCSAVRFQIYQHHIKGGNYRMKLLKLLIVPGVFVFSVVLAAPVFAHHLTNAVIVQAQCQGGQICVTLSGNVEPGTDERHVFIDIFAQGSSQPLGEIKFVVPENSTNQSVPMSPETECFHAITASSGTSFILKVMKVTAKDDTTAADLTITVQASHQEIEFKGAPPPQQPAVIENVSLTQCVTQIPPSPQTPTPSASAAVTTTLAGTGGFDFRFPLIGLTALVAGLALLLVSASRGRSSTK